MKMTVHLPMLFYSSIARIQMLALPSKNVSLRSKMEKRRCESEIMKSVIEK